MGLASVSAQLRTKRSILLQLICPIHSQALFLGQWDSLDEPPTERWKGTGRKIHLPYTAYPLRNEAKKHKYTKGLFLLAFPTRFLMH